MIKNNLLAQMLIAIIVVLLLISSLQMFGWGKGVGNIAIQADNLEDIPKVPQVPVVNVDDTKVDDKMLLEEIAKRPVFNSDRLPFVEPIIEEIVEQSEQAIVINELKAQLTGVVITPEQSYAMILDTTTNQRQTYQVGMPLDGEQGGWTLNSIQSRKVTFVSDDEKIAELELEVYSQQLKTGKQKNNLANTAANDKNDPAENATSREQKKKNADDIRKKIAERRAQMREEAAKKNN